MINTSSLVSIIIPTFNRGHIIGETLDSVIAQIYQNWECIVVDDGSLDNTAEVMAKYTAKDSRIQYYHRPPEYKPGGNGARNYGFTLSKGEYIQWFDSDDIMYGNFLQEKIKQIVSENGDAIFCAFQYFDNSGIQKRISNNIFSGDIFQDRIRIKTSFSPLSFLLSRQIINIQFDENLKRAQDADFFLRLFSQNRYIKILHIPKSLFMVRKHSATISGNSEKKSYYSRYIVNYRFYQYFLKTKNIEGIIAYEKRCLKTLKRLNARDKRKIPLSVIKGFKGLSLKQRIYFYFNFLFLKIIYF